AGRRILDLYEDLRDGHNLISLLEVLAHDILPRERGHMRFHKIQNVQIALDYLRLKGIRIVNIRSDEIVDGNPKLTLGLIWTIILHFQAFFVTPEFNNSTPCHSSSFRREPWNPPNVNMSQSSKLSRQPESSIHSPPVAPSSLPVS
ncbi:microtubule-actin cross-linking factor 1-like isoform X9, partial [Biomphalaria pfeifferi]